MSQQAAIAIAKKRKQGIQHDQNDPNALNATETTPNDSNSDYEAQADDAESDQDDSDSASINSDELDDAPIKTKGHHSSPEKPIHSASTTRTTSQASSKIKRAKNGPASPTITKQTIDFLRCLQDAEKNDRDWFQAHKEVYNEALENWRACVESIITHIADRVPTIPFLPPKDLIYRIYRDVRFSANKTPYKDNMSFSVTRTGRKGPLAGIYCHIRPGNNSLICIGKWDPDRVELQRIRQNITDNAVQLRDVLRQPDFIRYFGSDKFDEKSEEWKKNPRQSVWGCEDMLKRNPKGVAPDAENIDLLRLKSIVVRHVFKDSDVLSESWPEQVAQVAEVAAPLMELLNDWMGYGAE